MTIDFINRLDRLRERNRRQRTRYDQIVDQGATVEQLAAFSLDLYVLTNDLIEFSAETLGRTKI